VPAAAVSVCGMVGWVGLVIPHVGRMLVDVADQTWQARQSSKPEVAHLTLKVRHSGKASKAPAMQTPSFSRDAGGASGV